MIKAILMLALSVSNSDPGITPQKVCAIQNAIRFGQAAWTEEQCQEVAAAFAATKDPVQSVAIAINESDLRPVVMANPKPGVFDVGLMGVRCVVVRGRCVNGHAKGYTLAQLQNPVINISVASKVLEGKRSELGQDFLRGYNGGSTEHGYAAKIAVLAAAIDGRQLKAKGKRIRELVGKIVRAVTAGKATS